MISEELLQSFIAEASDLLDDVEPSLVEYSRIKDIDERTEIVNRVFRHFHSIKGSAGFVGLHDIARLTHEAETLLEQFRKTPSKTITQNHISLLCRTVDLLRAIFNNGGNERGLDENGDGINSLIKEIAGATQNLKSSTTLGFSALNLDVNANTTQKVESSGPSATQFVDPMEVGARALEAKIDLDLGAPEAGSVVTIPAAAAPPPTRPAAPSSEALRPEHSGPVAAQTGVGPRKSPDTRTIVGRGKPGKTITRQGAAGETKSFSHRSDTARVIHTGTDRARVPGSVTTGEFAGRYVTEANELLEQIEQSLLHAEQHPESSSDHVQEALRCLHSFKGNSGFMNLADLERLSHRMESEVEANIGKSLGLDSQTFDVLLQMIDVLRQGVLDFSCGGSGNIPEADAYIEMMDEFTHSQTGRLTMQARRRGDTGKAAEPGEKTDVAEKTEKATEKTEKEPEVKQDIDKKTELKEIPVPEPVRPKPKERTTRTISSGPQRIAGTDTTRFVLRGNTAQQEDLASKPKAENINMAPPTPQPQKPAAEEQRVRTTAFEVASPYSRPKASKDKETERIGGKQQSAPPQQQEQKPKSDTQKRRTMEQLSSRNDIRVDLRKLDAMLDLVGELVIAEAMVTRHPVVCNADNESLERAVHQLRRVAGSLQDMATSVRMIPLAPTFRRMTRLVYDLSVKAGKQVDLVLLGEDTEVDRTVIERISDPLVHIIRNAIDHGLESPEERIALGKPETGRLTIEGHHEGGEVWIVITDDGRGLDRDAIFAKAMSRGMMPSDTLELSDSQIFHFIFEPGFSTAAKVTDISGRGFGMDVVKKNIEKLSGKIDIRTRPGEGTAVVMRIPLTLAIIEGMLIRAGDTRYIIPLLSIRESLRPEQSMIMSTPDGQELVKIRDELIPIVKLEETFTRIKSDRGLMDGILMIVEGEDGDVVALFADELLGQQETVIKGLSGWLKKSRGVSGCTILGDGEVGLILDIGAIVNLARQGPMAKPA